MKASDIKLAKSGLIYANGDKVGAWYPMALGGFGFDLYASKYRAYPMYSMWVDAKAKVKELAARYMGDLA